MSLKPSKAITKTRARAKPLKRLYQADTETAFWTLNHMIQHEIKPIYYFLDKNPLTRNYLWHRGDAPIHYQYGHSWLWLPKYILLYFEPEMLNSWEYAFYPLFLKERGVRKRYYNYLFNRRKLRKNSNLSRQPNYKDSLAKIDFSLFKQNDK
jgi:hypothetical protein